MINCSTNLINLDEAVRTTRHQQRFESVSCDRQYSLVELELVRVLHHAADVGRASVETAQVNRLQGAIVVADKQLQAVLVKR